MIGRFQDFPLSKLGYTRLDFSDGRMVEIGGNLALKSRNLALFPGLMADNDRCHPLRRLGGGVLFPTISQHGFSSRGHPEYC